jgi:hypothetical protein
MMVALPRGANAGARLALAMLLALGAVSLVACGEGRTYYPVRFCYEPRCERINVHGETRKRFAVALEPERFAAIPARQDVMLTWGRGGGSTTFSLTQDFQFECRVADQRDWRCTGPAEPGFYAEVYLMGDGEPSHSEKRPFGGGLPSAIHYTSWCDWKQVTWHNDTSNTDDPPGHREHVLPAPLLMIVYWMTGCIV